MTDDTLLSDTSGDAQAIIDITREAVKPQDIESGSLYVLIDRDGQQRVVDTAEFSSVPTRDTRTVTVFDADSFTSYVGKHAPADESDYLEVWADEQNLRVTAILNAPTALTGGWSDHRAALALTKSPEWNAWTGMSGRLNPQTSFAEHIEDNLPDIISPTGAEMLELSQTFQAKSKVDFTSHQFLDNGMRALQYVETAEATAGRKGTIEIPATFELALRPFIGSPPFKVRARLRWRISEGHLAIGYKLDRPDEVLTAAFTDVVKAIGENVPVRVNAGRA